MCSIIKIVCNESVTAKKVDDAALEKFNMKSGMGGEDLNCVWGDERAMGIAQIVHEAVHVRESGHA